jgi:tRNA (guanine37-N1)-methyltransferase
MVSYNIFSLHPNIFSSFFENSLIARGVAQEIITYQLINWREQHGLGNYKQVDDRPYGGGSGMVLQPEPIYQSLLEHNSVSPLFEPSATPSDHISYTPPNSRFVDYLAQNPEHKRVTISMTPRGYPLTQDICQWLTRFETISILCGRYEGFDARVTETVDLELSLGSFVLNGGEVAAMSLIEAVSRLLPDFVTKEGSVMHDSFSASLNSYKEYEEYLPNPSIALTQKEPNSHLFDENLWIQNILPHLEHPQYTRPQTWMNYSVPQVLLEGNHAHIDTWRKKWY